MAVFKVIIPEKLIVAEPAEVVPFITIFPLPIEAIVAFVDTLPVPLTKLTVIPTVKPLVEQVIVVVPFNVALTLLTPEFTLETYRFCEPTGAYILFNELAIVTLGLVIIFAFPLYTTPVKAPVVEVAVEKAVNVVEVGMPVPVTVDPTTKLVFKLVL